MDLDKAVLVHTLIQFLLLLTILSRLRELMMLASQETTIFVHHERPIGIKPLPDRTLHQRLIKSILALEVASPIMMVLNLMILIIDDDMVINLAIFQRTGILIALMIGLLIIYFRLFACAWVNKALTLIHSLTRLLILVLLVIMALIQLLKLLIILSFT